MAFVSCSLLADGGREGDGSSTSGPGQVKPQANGELQQWEAPAGNTSKELSRTIQSGETVRAVALPSKNRKTARCWKTTIGKSQARAQTESQQMSDVIQI